MKYKKYLILLVVSFALVIFTSTTKVSAASYNYDYWHNIVYSSEGLSHKDTFYDQDILNPNGTTPVDANGNPLVKFNTLEDMAVYGERIYVLDAKTRDSKTLTFGGVSTSVDGASTVYVLDKSFNYVGQQSVFAITKSAKAQLERFYTYFDEEKGETVRVYETENAKNNYQDRVYIPYPDGFTPKTKSGLDLAENTAVILRNARGITVTKDALYIADTGHYRIFKLDKDTYTVTGVYLTPNDETFRNPWVFSEASDGKQLFYPIKLAIDVANRVYCVADRIYEGILEFNDNGEFNRFLGVNKVVPNPLKAFWTKIMTETQIAQIALDLPPMFTNLSIDKKGFLYTTSKPSDNTQATNLIKAINTSGKDVLKRNGYTEPSGDAVYIGASTNPQIPIGPSSLNAITVSDNGIYTAVDTKRGRMFTYDNEGNLLYITGEKGTLSHNLNEPVAIRYLGNDIVVVDRESRSLIRFQVTKFGSLINEATELYNQGLVIEAESIWREVLKMNSNYELAYVGIGKSLLRQGKYKEAMENFKMGNNKTYYSKAFQGYRDEFLEENFGIIMTSLVAIVVAYGAYKGYKYIKRRNEEDYEGGDENA
jgi:hypothetical protein